MILLYLALTKKPRLLPEKAELQANRSYYSPAFASRRRAETARLPTPRTVSASAASGEGSGAEMGVNWKLPHGGSLLGQDIVWETRVRYVTPPYFWFALWTAGNKWKWDNHAEGAEQDLVESFGYDNGDNPTFKNFGGRMWYVNSVGGHDATDYGDLGKGMSSHGIKAYDASQYHIWTWLYKKDNSYAMYVDGILVQSGTDYHWTYGDHAADESIDMDFLFDGGWGQTQIGSVNRPLPASAFLGKFCEWNYSRVYLSRDTAAPATLK